MFRGIHLVSLDVKGRLVLPSRYQKILGKTIKVSLIVTIDSEQKCLLLYPLSEWIQIEEKLNALPGFNASARRIQRLLIGHATEIDADAHARILIPPLLRQYAGLEQKAMLVGQGKKIEIWSAEHWEEQREMWLMEHLESGTDLPTELRSLPL